MLHRNIIICYKSLLTIMFDGNKIQKFFEYLLVKNELYSELLCVDDVPGFAWISPFLQLKTSFDRNS